MQSTTIDRRRFVALTGALFVALVAVFALVVVLAFILKPFLPVGGWCIDDQEVDTAAQVALPERNCKCPISVCGPATFDHNVRARNGGRRVAAQENCRTSNLFSGNELLGWLGC